MLILETFYAVEREVKELMYQMELRSDKASVKMYNNITYYAT